MTQLTFYGGVDEIGGNKILVEDGERRLFLDFGFPYKGYKLFYEEYLKPRSGAGLLDPLAMGLLPPLEELYRHDLSTPGVWQQFSHHPLYRKLGHVDGVLLSHAHLDHSGYISFLREEIPVYSTALTAFIAKAMQDSARSDFDQQVCYFSPTVYQCPTGWKQDACITDTATPKKQRQFRIGDMDPQNLRPDATTFWTHGFWERTPRQKELESLPLGGHDACPLNVRCFPVDHSILGACAWGVETSSGWVIYSGDLRLHGKRGDLTRTFADQAAQLRPHVLVLEGTNVLRDTNVTEEELHQNARRAIAESHGLVIADFSPRDVDRLLTFLDIARETNRKLAILPKDAYLLKTVQLLQPEVPAAEDDSLVIYQDTIGSKYPSLWMRNICQEYGSKVVLASDVGSAQDGFILCFSFFDLNELPSIRPEPGSLYLYSSSEPHDEEQEIDFRRLHAWLDHFDLRGVGLPIETPQGWQIPDAERGLHASGHACGPDLLMLARQIEPEVLIPVHTEHAEYYAQQLSGTRIRVILPTVGGSVEI